MGNSASGGMNMMRPQEPKPGVKPPLPNMQQFKPPMPAQASVGAIKPLGAVKPLGGMPAMPPAINNVQQQMPQQQANPMRQAVQGRVKPVKPVSAMPRRPLRGMY
jgi:hypothetical protein